MRRILMGRESRNSWIRWSYMQTEREFLTMIYAQSTSAYSRFTHDRVWISPQDETWSYLRFVCDLASSSYTLSAPLAAKGRSIVRGHDYLRTPSSLLGLSPLHARSLLSFSRQFVSRPAPPLPRGPLRQQLLRRIGSSISGPFHRTLGWTPRRGSRG
ncbi:hypothetical protein H2248_005675 [Termitomyces sp. 'cryptogamus']|nr:hypothetical protein H2248_005675 [Termitomyces sp. 'cryptogamus']